MREQKKLKNNIFTTTSLPEDKKKNRFRKAPSLIFVNTIP